MNTLDIEYDDNDPDYKVQHRMKRHASTGSTGSTGSTSSRRPTYGRSRAKKPTQVNGMHRRRSRRIMW